MENKNSVVLFSVIFLIIGVFVGWLFCSNKQAAYDVPEGRHMMDNGKMMKNGTMGMNDAMGSMMMGLKGKTGDAFDQAFLSQMIMHHQGAIVMAEAVLETSKRPKLIKLANDIITAQTKEIEMMKSWLKSWYGEDYR